jgi:hypothetical protein
MPDQRLQLSAAGAIMTIRGRAMNCVVTLLVLGFAAASMAAAQGVPSDLTALAAKARLDGPVVAWCRAEFRTGHPGAFAVGVTTAAGGKYVALDADGTVMELGSFKGSADLSCYSRPEAEKLGVSIRQSDTVLGHITPRWSTTAVCGFIEDTAAECWQYSPADRAFVKVGEWVT